MNKQTPVNHVVSNNFIVECDRNKTLQDRINSDWLQLKD